MVPDKPFGNSVVKEIDQFVVVLARIQKRARFPMPPDLRPR